MRTTYGPPEVVEVTEVREPVPGAGEVLIRVHATTVNRTDCGIRAAKPAILRLILGPRKPRRTIIGTEFAGTVEAVGDGARGFAVGDRVFGYDERTFGAHAEYKCMPASGAMALIPNGMTFEQAAPGTEGTHYALGFIRKTGVGAGHRVLVNGGTGGIGSAAIQLLKHRGAEITATCRGEHLDLVRGLGADRVIDYTAEDFTRVAGGDYDVVLDAVGKSSFGRCKPLLKPKGLYVSSELGPKGQNPLLALVSPVMPGKKVLFPFPRYDKAMVEGFAELMASGDLKPLVDDQSYLLDDIVEAYRYVESGQKVGNVVLSLEDLS